MQKEPINIRNCTFGFKCTKSWDKMVQTQSRDVKFCDNCQKEVYLVTDEIELMEAIELNRCVAIYSPGYRTKIDGPEHLLGDVTDYSDK